MFTGLIEQVGKVSSLMETDFGRRIQIECPLFLELPNEGASISISGCCLTVVSATSFPIFMHIDFDIVEETLKCTTLGSLAVGDSVNIEQSLLPSTRIGGHFVQGHVECTEQIISKSEDNSKEYRLEISMNSVDRNAVIPKGSITIQGVSLTIATVNKRTFEIALIPTTRDETTLGESNVGDYINVETDILARTVLHMMQR